MPVDEQDPGTIEKKNWLPMKAFDYAGTFQKVGRSTKILISRWHVVKNHTMYIYGNKYATEPKRKKSLKCIDNKTLYRYYLLKRMLL